MKNKNVIYKKGISLAVLMVTVIVSLILISTLALSTIDSIDTANLKVFAMDLREITEATEEYYIINNIMPTINDAGSMSRAEILNITRYSNELTSELTENGDLDSNFYAIDLDKINVQKTSYGKKVAGESDIFVIAFPSMNVYYLHGFKVKDKVYISLVEELSSLVNIPLDNLDNSTVTVISSDGITLRKSNDWANKMGVNLQTKMDSGETLYMSVSGGTNRLITTVEGENSFGFNLLSDIVANKETMKVPTLTTEEANYIELGTKPYSERYVDILKYKGTDLIGKLRIDLRNFSKNLPTITQAVRSSYSRMNVVKLDFANSESGIKEVRYEYLTKFDEGGTIINYFTGISDFDAAYMKSKGKKTNLTSKLTTSINAPKEVQSIKVAIIDNAGNVNLYNQIIAPDLYIGFTVDNLEQESLQVTANVYSTTGVKTVTFAKGTDGVNYTDEQIHQVNMTGSGVVTKQSDPFTNIDSDNVYIHMSATDYNDNIKEYRTVKLNLVKEEIPEQSEDSMGEFANKPMLVSGMTAKKWDNSGWVTVSNPDTDTSWYDYSEGKNEWANAQMNQEWVLIVMGSALQ